MALALSDLCQQANAYPAPLMAAIVARLGRGQTPAQISRWLGYAYPDMSGSERTKLPWAALASVDQVADRTAGSVGLMGLMLQTRLAQLAASGDHRAAVSAASELAGLIGVGRDISEAIAQVSNAGYLVTMPPELGGDGIEPDGPSHPPGSPFAD